MAPSPPKAGTAAIVRAMLDGVRHSYVGGSNTNQDLALFRPSNSSADVAVMRDHAMVRARARDLVRNHPYARQTVRMSRLGVIGEKLKYSCRPDWRFLGIDPKEARRWAQQFERRWEAYAHSHDFWIDAGRRLDFTQFMGLVHDSDLVDGEALVSFEWDENRAWRSCFQNIDVDRLSNPHGRPDSPYLRGGVDMDDFSAPIGYHIRSGHPHDLGLDMGRSLYWDRVPRWSDYGRANVMHTYEVQRPGQTRGISTFAPVIRAMKVGEEYGEMALSAAVLQASVAAVLTSASNAEQVATMLDALDTDDIDGNAITSYALEHLAEMAKYYGEEGINFTIANGAQVKHLAPGDQLDLKNPGQHMAGYGEFQQAQIKKYAAGTGTDPIAVSQDYSQVNYSSAKMAAAHNYRSYAARRVRLCNTVAMPMVGAFLDELFFAAGFDLPKGIDPAQYFDFKHALICGMFLTQGAPNLEPLKEAQALQNEIALGVKTIEEACAERGKDYLEELDKLETEVADYQARGLQHPMMLGMPAQMPEDEDAGKKDNGDDEEG